MKATDRFTRIAVALTALLLLLASCNGNGSGGATETPEPEPAPSPTLDESPEPEPEGDTAYELWFVDGEQVTSIGRLGPTTEAIGRAALDALLAGPDAQESDMGFDSEVPGGTELLGLTISDGTATVDLSGDFTSGGGSLSMQLRTAQVVHTLTQFSTVDRVTFHIDGEPVDGIGGEGIPASEVTREDFEDVTAPITVTWPRPGDELTGSLVVGGTANVFEANVSIRLLDADGNEILSTFTTATCGSGCRGDYEEEISFDATGPATLEVFESSAEDGRPLHTVERLVILY